MENFREELRTSVEKFCLSTIEPTVHEDDHNQKFRMETFKGLGQLGVLGMVLPEKYEGSGLNYTDFNYILMEIAKYSVSYAVTASVSSMVARIINDFGNEEQKQKFLPSLATGEVIGSFSLSESGSGSDAAALKTKAELKGDHYLLNGTKMWVTSGGLSEVYVVMARTGEEGPKGISSFIVPKDTPGFSIGKKEEKLGWKVSPTTELVFENCKVPKENLLSSEGEGFKIAMSALDKGRFTIGAIAVGLAQRAFDEALKYSLLRKQFGKPLYDNQGLQFMFADLAVEIEASKLLVQQAADLFDKGENNPKLSAFSKLKATDTAMKVTTDSVQILGGAGFTTEYPLERFMRDAKGLQIVEGANQIQKVVIARNLKKEYSE